MIKIIRSFSVVIILIFAFTSIKSHAINWYKCSRDVIFRANGAGVFLSTSSFFTSTGACSMIGMRSHDRKVFIAQNLEPLKGDSARGKGEYLNSFAYLMGCNKTGTQKLSGALQSKFTRVFGDDVKATPQEAYEQVERLIREDSTLKGHCSLSLI